MENVIIIDSIAMAKPEHAGKVIVAGSHGGLIAAKYAMNASPKLVFLNDAGRGKNDAGIGSIYYLEEQNVAAATVDTLTAMIGNGQDAYDCGVISYLNETAKALGLEAGMKVKDAVAKVLEG